MTKSLSNVLYFHQIFNCPVGSSPSIPHDAHDQELQTTYDKLMLIRSYLRQFAKSSVRCQRVALAVEELAELTKSLKDHDIISALDALGDIEYINNGTAVVLGVHEVLPEALERIHHSNLSKLEDGKPVYDEVGKVKKGKGYKPVDLSDLVCQS